MRTEKEFLTLHTNHMNMSAKKYPHLTSPIKLDSIPDHQVPTKAHALITNLLTLKSP